MPQPQVQSPNYKSKARLQNKATTRRLIKRKGGRRPPFPIRALSPSYKSKAPKRRQGPNHKAKAPATSPKAQSPNHKSKAPTTSPKPRLQNKATTRRPIKKKVAAGHLPPYEFSAPPTSPKARREDKVPATSPQP